MNRRDFFARFGLVAVPPQVLDEIRITPAVAPVLCDPVCPECGGYLVSQDIAWRRDGELHDVECPCGWKGSAQWSAFL